ncbi:nucleotidyltransferase family protein [Neorhizobium sp. NPDC001467]|uniref:nucleotidyltransferase family protein n=1 Tax=Neorhizobium sp. NPDC001467 TaxID=3390595 RepID=UPI003D039C8D
MSNEEGVLANGRDDRDVLTIGAVLLAAGQSRRMNGQHKLLAEFDGIPLVRRSAQMLLASLARPVVVVTGHRRDEIEAQLSGLDLQIRFNANYRSGMAGSLTCGLSDAELAKCAGLLVMLADMPAIESAHVDHLIGRFRQAGGGAIVRAASGSQPGHPVIFPAAVFYGIRQLQGDVGARGIVQCGGLPVLDVEIGSAAGIDVDTPEAVMAHGGILRG